MPWMRPKNARLIVFAGKHVDVPGWYITRNKTKAFEISGYEDSVAKRVGNTTSIGTITATFSACWTQVNRGLPTNQAAIQRRKSH